MSLSGWGSLKQGEKGNKMKEKKQNKTVQLLEIELSRSCGTCRGPCVSRDVADFT